MRACHDELDTPPSVRMNQKGACCRSEAKRDQAHLIDSSSRWVLGADPERNKMHACGGKRAFGLDGKASDERVSRERAIMGFSPSKYKNRAPQPRRPAPIQASQNPCRLGRKDKSKGCTWVGDEREEERTSPPSSSRSRSEWVRVMRPWRPIITDRLSRRRRRGGGSTCRATHTNPNPETTRRSP